MKRWSRPTQRRRGGCGSNWVPMPLAILRGLDSEVIFNSGCYPGSPVGISLLITGSMYDIPNVHVAGMDVLSFRQSVGAYRAPGIPQSMFALESVVDEVAAALDMDPMAIRLQNAAKEGDPLINGDPWPKMGMSEVLQALQEHPLWQNREASRAAGRGVGIAVGGWLGGHRASFCSLSIRT